MKKITYNNKTYEIPTSWDEVTLSKQIKVSNDAKEIKSDVAKKIALISGYCNIPIDELKRENIKNLGPLFKHLSFLSKAVPDKPVYEFKFMGHDYYVSQNLLEQEFQDFISLESILSNNDNDVYKALPQVIAILAKRKVDGKLESLDDYDIDERAKIFEELPISIANGLGVFFYNSVSTYRNSTHLFSQTQTKKLLEMKQKEVSSTLNKLDGGVLRFLLRILLRNYLKYLKRESNTLLTTIPSKS